MSNSSNPIDLAAMTDKQLLDLAESLNVLDERKKFNKQAFLFPETGPFPRHLYKKAMIFFKAGDVYKERALIAGNRTGKTYNATAEMGYHLNGRYPEWWQGKRFHEPIKAWSIGKTHETTRDILQSYMLGKKLELGSGMIPKEDIERTTTKTGIPDAIQDVYVKHYTKGIFDGYSELTFKSYVQGVEAFMGTSIHVCHLDEEPDNPSIYSECVTRTMTTKGIIMCTFTPLMGLSEVVLSFLPGGKFPVGGIGAVDHDNLPNKR